MDTTIYQRQIVKNLQNELNQKRASGDDSWTIKFVKGVPSLGKKLASICNAIFSNVNSLNQTKIM